MKSIVKVSCFILILAVVLTAFNLPAGADQSKDPLVVTMLGEKIRYSHIDYDPNDEFMKDFFNAVMGLIHMVRDRAIEDFKKKNHPGASWAEICRALYRKYGGIVKMTKVAATPSVLTLRF